MKSAEEQYLEILQELVDTNVTKDNRTSDCCYIVPPKFIQHDMSTGFPLLTTKKMGIKTIATELEFFIGGLTDKQWLTDRNCHIWDGWCNPMTLPDGIDDTERKELQLLENDLGPVYGYQWRRFGKVYIDGVSNRTPFTPATTIAEADELGDQLARVILTLKSNPNDRRMYVSAWNPKEICRQALPPCHIAFNIVHINGVLHLVWNQRSNDFMLGNPFNIASYALLLELICMEVGMVAGTLTGQFSDVHLYEHHMDVAKEQCDRQPLNMPKIKINNWTNIWEWKASDVEIVDYESHGKLTARVSI